MTFLVYSNVLLDVMTEDTHWFARSADDTERAATTTRVVIDPVIYAEVPMFYRRGTSLHSAPGMMSLTLEQVVRAAGFPCR